MIVTDLDLVQCDLDSASYRVVAAPFARTATVVLGRRQVMNIVALGVFQVASGLISQEAFLKAIEKAVPERFIELNKKAFLEGVKIGKEALERA